MTGLIDVVPMRVIVLVPTSSDFIWPSARSDEDERGEVKVS